MNLFPRRMISVLESVGVPVGLAALTALAQVISGANFGPASALIVGAATAGIAAAQHWLEGLKQS